MSSEYEDDYGYSNPRYAERQGVPYSEDPDERWDIEHLGYIGRYFRVRPLETVHLPEEDQQ